MPDAKDMRIDKEALIDIAYGAAFLGGGGGGSLVSTLTLLEQWFRRSPGAQGPLLRRAGRGNELGLVCSFVGAQSRGKAVTTIDALEASVERLKDLAEEGNRARVKALLPAELGVQSAVVPACLAAADLGIAVLDADGAGRAVPDLAATRLSDELFPERVILADASDIITFEERRQDSPSKATERLFRKVLALCDASQSGILGMALWANRLAHLSKAAVSGTLSFAREIGALLRRSSDEALTEALEKYRPGSRFLFEGTVLEKREIVHDCYVIAVGAGKALWTAGETIVAYDLDANQPLALLPDAICVVGKRKGRDELFPLTNVDLSPGDWVRVYGISADPTISASLPLAGVFEKWRTFVGYSRPYATIQQLARRN